MALIFCNNICCIVHLQRLAKIQLKLKFVAGLYRKSDKLSLISIKRKSHPVICHEGTEGDYGCSCTLSLTSALGNIIGQRHSPTGLFPGRDPVRILQVGPRAGLNVCRKSRLRLCSNPESCRHYQVVIPITSYQYFIKCVVILTLFP